MANSAITTRFKINKLILQSIEKLQINGLALKFELSKVFHMKIR